MDSLDAFIYQVGSIAYIKAEDGQNQPTAGTLPRHLREIGYFKLVLS